MTPALESRAGTAPAQRSRVSPRPRRQRTASRSRRHKRAEGPGRRYVRYVGGGRDVVRRDVVRRDVVPGGLARSLLWGDVGHGARSCLSPSPPPFHAGVHPPNSGSQTRARASKVGGALWPAANPFDRHIGSTIPRLDNPYSDLRTSNPHSPSSGQLIGSPNDLCRPFECRDRPQASSVVSEVARPRWSTQGPIAAVATCRGLSTRDCRLGYRPAWSESS